MANRFPSSLNEATNKLSTDVLVIQKDGENEVKKITIDTLLSDKVGLSGYGSYIKTQYENESDTNALTDLLLIKLNDLENYIHPTAHSATMIVTDASGFSGNLDPADVNLQLIIDKIDSLSVSVSKIRLVGVNTQTDIDAGFTISNETLVYIDGVIQRPSEYTFSGNIVTLKTPLDGDEDLVILA